MSLRGGEVGRGVLLRVLLREPLAPLDGLRLGLAEAGVGEAALLRMLLC